MVPYFDPMPIEVATGFGLACGFNLAMVFGLTKGEAIGVGTLIMPPPLVPLSNGPKIDHFSHSVALDGNGLHFSSALHVIGSIAAKCAETLAERCLSNGVHKSASDTVAPVAPVFNTRLVDYKRRINDHCRI
jgi:hypothetical protein